MKELLIEARKKLDAYIAEDKRIADEEFIEKMKKYEEETAATNEKALEYAKHLFSFIPEKIDDALCERKSEFILCMFESENPSYYHQRVLYMLEGLLYEEGIEFDNCTEQITYDDLCDRALHFTQNYIKVKF